jgi:hypothetical protein
MMDDEFYRERARHIRELADKADSFIRKRLLDLAGNYDAMVRRSHRATAVVPPPSRTSQRNVYPETPSSSAAKPSEGSVLRFRFGWHLSAQAAQDL